ncbi:MAG: hypothetical protein JXQ71_08285 [Verrucomicrobia bacterium]|nr:hypothetical protein [Verrucomicrobiota bacterium]
MNPIHLRSLSAALLAASLGVAHAQPLATLTVRSYRDLQQAATRLGRALDPEASDDAGRQLGMMLGVKEDATFDVRRPWQVAVWYEGGKMPLVALKVPTTDLDRFKEGLSPQGVLRQQAAEWKALEGGWGLVTLRQRAMLSATEASALEGWETQAVAPPRQAVHVAFHLNEPLRQAGLAMLTQAKRLMRDVLATNDVFAAPGTNPKAMVDLMTGYFELLETALRGMQQLRLGIDVTTDTLAVETALAAKPETELARWLRPQAGRITAHELRHIDPQAMLSTAGHWADASDHMNWLRRMTVLGLQMQNIPPDDPMVKELDRMLLAMLPMNVGMSLYWTDRMSFAGAYRFPHSTPAKAYATMTGFLDKSMRAMTGPDKFYAAMTFETNHHAVGQIPVDRFTLTLNTNSPLLRMPGQAEQLSAMWPEGRLVFEYAIRGDQLFFATPDRMPALLATPAPSKPAWTAPLKDTTVLAGYLDLIAMIQRSVAANPMLPEAMKTKLARLQSEGTRVQFQVDLDQQGRTSWRVPMKLLREFRRMAEPPER